MPLSFEYCKEIAKELDLIPVYLPGSQINVGDIITFGEDFFGNAVKPLGTFIHSTTLSNLGIQVNSKLATDKRTYKYATRNGTKVSFKTANKVGSLGSGELEVKFLKEGSSFLYALNCQENSLQNLPQLHMDLEKNNSNVNWNHHYIVSSVMIAEQAIIMQSSSSSGSLLIEGDVHNLQPHIATNISSSVIVSKTRSKDSAFFQEWSSNVAIFMKLIRWKKNLFRDSKIQILGDENMGIGNLDMSNFEEVGTKDL